LTGSPLPRAPVGAVIAERRHRVDQDLITRYAHVSGDFNPLHLDPEFAATTPFGRIIAHGMMTLAFVSEAMRDWAGQSWEEAGRLAVTFIAPVFAGDEVTVRIEVRDISGEATTCKVECWVGDRLTLTGEADIPAGASAAADG
jgi:3-hydroxybutyryl-CoA dehydratase